MVNFTKNMSIKEALERHPDARDIFVKYGMGCTICSGAILENIEAGAKIHGINPDLVIKDLNKLKLQETNFELSE